MRRRTMLAALAAVMMAACSGDTTAPDSAAADFELASFDVFGDGYGMAAGPRGLPGQPVVGRLLMQAIAKVRAEQGEDAARALLEPVHALRLEAHAARQAGDVELFREKIAAVHAAAAAIIVDILGAERAAEMIAFATARLADLDAVIATRREAGADVARLEQARARAGELLASAQASLDDGDVLAAMVKAARATQMAAIATHHGRQHPGRRG